MQHFFALQRILQLAVIETAAFFLKLQGNHFQLHAFS
jgi:hypothetical protein